MASTRQPWSPTCDNVDLWPVCDAELARAADVPRVLCAEACRSIEEAAQEGDSVVVIARIRGFVTRVT